MAEGLCPLPNLDPYVGAHRGAKFHQEYGAIFSEE